MSEKVCLVPSWLETHPASEVPLPVDTRHQNLPFGSLTWEDFQKLCLRLVRLEANVEHCQVYGTQGQKQEGIDLFARQKLSAKYRVYQCKRVTTFGPAEIRGAVSEFLSGTWVDRTEIFVLCTQDTMVPTKKADALEEQNILLKAKGITLLPWGAEELNAKLKGCPEVVNDFFGREWVKKFIGEGAAIALGRRLDLAQVREFRNRCRQLYSHVFESHDPGIPSAQLGSSSSLSITSRFIVPDIYDCQRALTPGVSDKEELEPSLGDTSVAYSEGMPFSATRPQKQSQFLDYRQRVKIGDWLTKGDRYVVLGGPGAGKSTLLRYIAIELLNESPRSTQLIEKWGGRLPLWIPFALWTKVISASDSGKSSLGQIIQQWLSNWDEQRLWPLFEQALEDERVLLLVDGLDEWTNESAASIALDRLRVFIGQRKIAAIVTSRPHGYKRLGMPEEGWQIGELCELSVSQQKELALIWFAEKVSTSNSGMERSEIDRLVSIESGRFMEELGNSPDLDELGKAPMLLCLLIFLRFQNAQLPQSRFKAYGQIVDYLILVHPKKRQQAASVTSVEGDLRDEDMKGLLAYLAFEIQEKHSEGLLDTKIAEELVRKRIEHDFGFERPKAIALARHVIQTSESAVGLLVAKSPVEIGFLHRTFQDYLAACGLSTVTYSVLSEKLESHCSKYQWHEVILALLTLTSRTEDVDDLLKKIKAKRDTAGPLDQYAIEHLLYEAALVHSKCSIELAKTVALEAFKTVEWGSWRPHRLRVSRIVLEGLRQPRLRDVITKRLRNWYPARERFRSSLLQAMATWGRSKEVSECLERCLNDEESSNQRAAAKTLARICAGDYETGEKVALLSKTLETPNARAAAIEALINGWSNHSDLEAILADASQSPSPEIRAIAIYGKIKKGIHQSDDLNLLLELGMQRLRLDFRWREIVHQGVKLGWPGSLEVKKMCLRSLRRYSQHDDNLDNEIALRLLMEGYPQDEEVADYCINEIQNENYPFLVGSLSSDVWKMIAENFRDHPGIVSAIDKWILRQEYSEPEVSWAALVGRTPIGKAKLLELDNVLFPHWFVQSLLEGWGMSDSQVSEALMGMAYKAARETSRIGHLLPSIVTDFAKCRGRLLDVLKDQACERPDFVLRGLQTLGSTEGDNEAVEIVLDRLASQTSLPNRYGVMSGLFLSYSWDSRVKDLALKELDIHEGQYGAVAMAYKDDLKIKSRVLEILCPLPSYLRRQVVESVVRGVGDEDFERSLLETYDLEFDQNLKIDGSIGFHRRLKQRASLTSGHLDELKRTLFCLGPDYQERRQGAFCGLMILEESEYIRNAREPWENGKPFSVPIRIRMEANISFIHFLLQNWKDCKPILFDGIPEEDERTMTHLWEELCLLAFEYELPRMDALNFLEDRSEGIAGPNILNGTSKNFQFLGRPFLALLVRWAKRPEHRVRGSDWLSA